MQPKADVFILGAGKPVRGRRPAALNRIALDTRALDWQIKSVANIAGTKLTFVGGYQVAEVIKNYPQLNYSVVPDWQRQSALHSLLGAPFTGSPATVFYADTIFRSDMVDTVVGGSADVVFGVDQNWRHRYRSRTSQDIDIAEVIKSTSETGEPSISEFTGLVRFNANVVSYLESLDIANAGNSIVDLIRHLESEGFSTESVDVGDGWAEFNSPDDIAHFILGTKADTLARLAPVVTKSHIGAQVAFTVSDWAKQRERIIGSIQDMFSGMKLIVRSSARSEDNWNTANAGGFDSMLGVDGSDSASLIESVDSVIRSYGQIDEEEEDQILVQEFIDDVACSGVVFTCGLETGAPFYRVNFDDSTNSTESVTSGSGDGLRTLIVYRDKTADVEIPSHKMIPVVEAVKELETLLGFDKLDVEFAVDATGKVHVFQVRPISVDHSEFDFVADEIPHRIASSATRFEELQQPGPFVLGSRAFFGNMPDWNPAEIIGTRPRPLAFSLYRELITDEVWAKQRADFGYRDVRPQPLMVAFCGQPYIDIRASINSFVPASLSNPVAERLVDAYLDILASDPVRHDKLEFDVVFTSWTPDFQALAKDRLGALGFSGAELMDLESGLKHVTAGSITRLKKDIDPIHALTRRRAQIEMSDLGLLDTAFLLIEDCREYGTPAFAHAARAGFVATSFLRSFVRLEVLTEINLNHFMNSIRTVTRQFAEDKAATRCGESTIAELLEQYGHLRPGTYDASLPAYWENPEQYLSDGNSEPAYEAPLEFEWPDRARVFIARMLEDLNVDFGPDTFFAYLAEAIQAREGVKFEFTRNLSRALDKIIAWGEEVGIARDEVIFLDYADLANYRAGAMSIDDLKAKIEPSRRRAVSCEMIELPQLIMSAADFYCFERFASQPNFVTLESVEAPTTVWKTSEKQSLVGRIVLIPQADPGYDWLFGRGIVGLITRYGGANSHMAIRAAEMGLPAAIGVGDQLYEQLSAAGRLRLDCKNHLIEVS